MMEIGSQLRYNECSDEKNFKGDTYRLEIDEHKCGVENFYICKLHLYLCHDM